MPEQSEETLELPEALAEFLGSRDMRAEAVEKIGGTRFKIYTSDDYFIGYVSATICLHDLQSLVLIYRREYSRGLEDGKTAIRSGIQALINSKM